MPFEGLAGAHAEQHARVAGFEFPPELVEAAVERGARDHIFRPRHDRRAPRHPPLPQRQAERERHGRHAGKRDPPFRQHPAREAAAVGHPEVRGVPRAHGDTGPAEHPQRGFRFGAGGIGDEEIHARLLHDRAQDQHGIAAIRGIGDPRTGDGAAQLAAAEAVFHRNAGDVAHDFARVRLEHPADRPRALQPAPDRILAPQGGPGRARHGGQPVADL